MQNKIRLQIVEADQSARKRMEGSLHKNHEDHIAGKGMNSIESLQFFVHKISSHAAGNENTRCKSSSG